MCWRGCATCVMNLCHFYPACRAQKPTNFWRADAKVLADVNFLCDIMSHLNPLNLQLQGKKHTVADMYEAIEALQSKLDAI